MTNGSCSRKCRQEDCCRIAPAVQQFEACPAREPRGADHPLVPSAARKRLEGNRPLTDQRCSKRSSAAGVYEFFPLIERRADREPTSIMITPTVSVGKPVIAETGISTAVIASRFHARESVSALAEEYGRPVGEAITLPGPPRYLRRVRLAAITLAISRSDTSAAFSM